MPAGRRPKPTRQKEIAGNPGKRPLNQREPKPKRGMPRRPSRLGKEARAAWRRIGPELDRLGVLTVGDGVALELLADAYAEYVAARDVVEAEGATYESETQNGIIIRARPEVKIASDAWRRIHKMLLEFGLTPAARTKVATIDDHDAETDPWLELVG